MIRLRSLVHICQVAKSYILPEISQETRRYAGHSKWANIKHQKSATDTERNRLFTRLSRMLKVAVIEGKSSDPEANGQLQSVIGQCKRANMPSSTIANSIKSAVSSKSNDEKSSIFHIRGPGRCSLLVEVLTPNLNLVKNNIAAVMKKHGCKYDPAVIHDYSEKGVLTANPLSESASPLDDATEHAIISSVEEVTWDEESKKLRFECSPEATMKAKKALEGLGYTIDAAIVEHLPIVTSELGDEQLEVIQKFVTKIENMPEVISVKDNIL